MRFRAGFVLGFVNVKLSLKKCATKKYPAHGSLKGGCPPKDGNDLGNRFPPRKERPICRFLRQSAPFRPV